MFLQKISKSSERRKRKKVTIWSWMLQKSVEKNIIEWEKSLSI